MPSPHPSPSHSQMEKPPQTYNQLRVRYNIIAAPHTHPQPKATIATASDQTTENNSGTELHRQSLKEIRILHPGNELLTRHNLTPRSLGHPNLKSHDIHRERIKHHILLFTPTHKHLIYH